jgi:ketosteroid isomerase-like protein
MAMTKEEVAEAVRAWCTAWHTHDIPTICAMETRAVGFGFRAVAARDHGARPAGHQAQFLEQFFGQKVYYCLEPEDFQTSVEGELGLAWGVYREAWQDTGQAPAQVRVRFSKVLTKGVSGWQVLLYHRDIQPFTEEGLYPKTLTVASPDN